MIPRLADLQPQGIMTEYMSLERKAEAFLKWADEQQGVKILIGRKDPISVKQRWICFLIFSRWGFPFNHIASFFRLDYSTVKNGIHKAKAIPGLVNESLYVEELFLKDHPGHRPKGGNS